MKMQVMSDLHLEFEPTFRPVNNGADVLVLSGDVCMAYYLTKGPESPYYTPAQEFRDFFRHCSQEFDHVMYVKGNHEAYRYYMDLTTDVLKDELSQYPNVHLLDNEFVDLDGYRFLGTTLWTDLNKGCPLTEQYLRGAMNDYRLVQWKSDYRKFHPMDSFKMHREGLKFLSQNLEGQDKCVVMTHHAPTFMSVHPKYHNQTYMNGGYYSELTEFILDHPQVKLWTHGHMHDCFDYMVGETEVVCNPRGYNGENQYFNPNKVWEV